MTSIDGRSKYYIGRWNSFNIQAKINRMGKLLADTRPEIEKAFKWDDEGLWSFTHHDISNEIADKILTMPDITQDCIVTDIMSSIGGITIPFAQKFKHVNAIEVDKNRYDMLCDNVSLYGLENVNTLNGYYQDFICDLQQDIIYLDPPWGIDYRKYKNITLQVSSSTDLVDLEDAICHLKNHAKYILVNIPITYDMRYFHNGIDGVCSIISKKDYPRPNSMRVIILK